MTYSEAMTGEISSDDRHDFVLRVLDLHKTYRSGFLRRCKKAIRGVSLVVPRGSIFAIVGPNGAGKTTTLKAVLDLVHADEGSVEIFGLANTDQRSRARLGYLPERPYFYEHLNARELLRFYGALFGMKGKSLDARIEELLELVGLGDAGGNRLSECSKGMLQRIGLAQALLNDPDLLILDEPMSGLDPVGRLEVRRLLGKLRTEGTTILLSSHIVPDVQALADTVAILKAGRIEKIVDMGARTASTSYEVTLGGKPIGPAADEILAACRTRVEAEQPGRLAVSVPDTEMLQKLLAVCTDHGIRVHSVESRRPDLEDILMESIMSGGEAATTPNIGSAKEAESQSQDAIGSSDEGGR